MTKKILISLILVVCFGLLFAQKPAKYWVQFADKANTIYSIAHPEKYLSPKAIENRKRFNIAITEQDFPVNRNYIEQILKLDTGMRLFTTSKWLNGITVYSQDSTIQQRIASLPFVENVEVTIHMKEPENFDYEKFTFVETEKPLIEPNTPLQKDLPYGNSISQHVLNNIHWLHRMGYQGQNVWMMIMDGGFLNTDEIKHFKTAFNEHRILITRNFVQPNKSVFRSGSHGTLVLSHIASYVPDNLIGTAPKALYCLAYTEDGRSENRIEEDNWVAGIEWADSLGCQVLNASLGYTTFDDTTVIRSHKTTDGKISRASQAATIAASKGMLVCNSAGNSAEEKWHYISCPADAKDIITVGATDDKGKIAPFSSFGPTADGRVKPDACAVGFMARGANTKGLTTFSFGTSCSSPMLAGMVACLRGAFPNKTNYEIIDVIRQSGNLYETPNDSLGYGITDFLKAYNLLLQPHVIYRTANDNISFKFKSYTATKNKIALNIKVPRETVMTFTATQRSDNKEEKETLKLKKGENIVSVKLPKIAKAWKFGLVDLQFSNGTQTYSFVVGNEKK